MLNGNRIYKDLEHTMNSFKRFKFQVFKENISSEADALRKKAKNIQEMKFKNSEKISDEEVD